jgi:redox-regulated HSP33 family molecular chaperone
MRKLLVAVKVILVITLIASGAPIVAAQSQGPMLKMIAIEAKSPGQIKKLARMGIDISED